MKYLCKRCNDVQFGEADCLKHTDKYGHFQYIDEHAKIYEPLKDNELMED